MDPGAEGARRGSLVGGGAAGVGKEAPEVGKEALGVGFFVSIRGRWDRGPGQGEGGASRGAGGRDVLGRVVATRGGVGTVAADLPPSGVASWRGEALPISDGGGGGEKQNVAGS